MLVKPKLDAITTTATTATARTLPTRMWANAQRDGRPAQFMWRPVFIAANFG